MTQTPTQPPMMRAASAALKRPVEDYIRERREQGETWQSIVRAIDRDTRGVIVVTPQTLANWVR